MSDKNLFDKYLQLIEVKRENPSYEFLCTIIKAQLIRIPFENISKLIYKKNGISNIPTFNKFLEGIEKYNFGGTCYSINYYLYLLLKHLGFDVKLCGADMRNPDVHVISMVNIEGKEFIIDCGYAAPFLGPMPRDNSEDYMITFGDEKYILKPKDAEGRSRLEQYFKDELKHWYTTKPQPRKSEEFLKVIKDSYSDNALFMNALLITRCSKEYSVAIRNLYLTETNGPETTIRKITKEEIPLLANQKFGMPVEIVTDAIADLKSLRDIYS